MTIINRTTFTATAESVVETYGDYTFSYVPGTVEVTLRGQTKRVEAKLFGDNDLVAYGMVGRYHTATKNWPANVASRIVNDKVRETARFGRDDNHPKFRKEDCISFA